MKMLDSTRVLIIVALIIVLGVPFLFKPEGATVDPDALSLVIITPHNEQIRHEFSVAFDAWYRAKYGKGVVIDWRTPGGTSEIRRQITSEYSSMLKDGPIRAGSMSYDLLFGGGSYEHGKIKRGVDAITDAGEKLHTAISEPINEFTNQDLFAWYGENTIGRNTLYDVEQYWFGTALSAFGIVFNRDVLRSLKIQDPTTWEDLTQPELQGWVALADPGQSGSICTTFEVILNRVGWDKGWRILRSSAANSRYFANSSSKVPIDVSMGEAAIGMCIDFYGRYQSQSISDGGGGDRVGYIDPKLISDIDPDPISLLLGAPHRELAIEFVRFCLSEEGQSLWQFRSWEHTGEPEDGLGPREYELRRMPSRRIMYANYQDRFVDQVNPFLLARDAENWDRNVRRTIAPLFSAMAIDNHAYLQEAWEAYQNAGQDHPNHAQMEQLLFAMPTITLHQEDDAVDNEVISLSTTERLADVRTRWKTKAEPSLKDLDRIAWTIFFRTNYQEVVRLADE